MASSVAGNCNRSLSSLLRLRAFVPHRPLYDNPSGRAFTGFALVPAPLSAPPPPNEGILIYGTGRAMISQGNWDASKRETFCQTARHEGV